MAQKSHTIDPTSMKQFVTACHDLRQYISAGLLLSQMPGDENLDEGVRHRFEMIHQQFRGAADLVASAVGAPEPRPWRVDLVDLVVDCVDLVQLVNSVSIETDLPDHAITYGDPLLLKRAVSNLLENACRAVLTHGKVVVRVEDHGSEMWVEVADTGRGFGQIPSGTGHGLSIVNAALRASTGRLQISSGPGLGTTVRLAFPAADGIAS